MLLGWTLWLPGSAWPLSGTLFCVSAAQPGLHVCQAQEDAPQVQDPLDLLLSSLLIPAGCTTHEQSVREPSIGGLCSIQLVRMQLSQIHKPVQHKKIDLRPKIHQKHPAELPDCERTFTLSLCLS